jgi:glutaminyl-tRNA synthetase
MELKNGEWEKDINKDSLVIKYGLVDASVGSPVANDKFQFERVGYFNTDFDSKPGKLVFNLTCYLKTGYKGK